MYKKHTGRVDTVAWSPDSQHCATGSIDQNIVVWSLEDFQKMAPSPLTIKRKYFVKTVHLLYLWHLCQGVYSFRLSVCPFVCSFVLPSVTLVEFRAKFYV